MHLYHCASAAVLFALVVAVQSTGFWRQRRQIGDGQFGDETTPFATDATTTEDYPAISDNLCVASTFRQSQCINRGSPNFNWGAESICQYIQRKTDCLYPEMVEQCGETAAAGDFCSFVSGSAETFKCWDLSCPSTETTMAPETTVPTEAITTTTSNNQCIAALVLDVKCLSVNQDLSNSLYMCNYVQSKINCMYPIVAETCGQSAADVNFCQIVSSYAESIQCEDISCPPAAPETTVEPETTAAQTEVETTVAQEATTAETGEVDNACVDDFNFTVCWNENITDFAFPKCEELKPLTDCLYPLLSDHCGKATADGYFCVNAKRYAETQLQNCQGYSCPSAFEQPQQQVWWDYDQWKKH